MLFIDNKTVDRVLTMDECIEAQDTALIWGRQEDPPAGLGEPNELPDERARVIGRFAPISSRAVRPTTGRPWRTCYSSVGCNAIFAPGRGQAWDDPPIRGVWSGLGGGGSDKNRSVGSVSNGIERAKVST